MSGARQPISVAIVTHVVTPAIVALVERVRREAPADHDVRLILSCDDLAADIGGLDEAMVERISLDDVFRLPYPQKCRAEDWQMAGNLDLVFLEFWRRRPSYGRFWFVEYDVHWEGVWGTFFEHFRASDAAVLGATVQHIDEVPHKEHRPPYPPLVVPAQVPWERANFIKAFLPLCRVSRAALEHLDRAYRHGLGGHYEVTVPTIAAQNGLPIEDFGGRGRFVRPENTDRFYFARGATYSHSPGTFVFRPTQHVLPRPNTLWHPVKPGGVPAWHPLSIRGGAVKSAVEWAKPLIWQAAIRLWFATRWRPLVARQTARRMLTARPLASER